VKRIVLAYSGGLNTSVAVGWLRDRYGADVVGVAMDLGQGRELDDIRERALAVGCLRAHVLDLREEFARDHVLPALQAGALYEHRYPMATSLGRPLLARHLVAVAEMEGADAVAHGCTGKGNDQVRFEVSARALRPGIQVIAPAREWGMTRAEVIARAKALGLPVPLAAMGPHGTDVNLWGRSIQCGVLEDPWIEPPEDVYGLTRSPLSCPDLPAYVEIRFERGVPVAVNDVAMPLLEVIGSLETIAGAHGVGRLDMVENRVVGIKTREVYEAPAAVVLHAAHRDLQALVVDRDLDRLAHQLSTQYADLVYNGLWFTPMREALDAFVRQVQERVTGTVRVKLFKGQCTAVGRQSPFALYDRGLATYDEGDAFDHEAARGFIQIFGLPAETAARRAPTAGAAHGGPVKG
jgi:argininosuccinate synthase